MQPEQLDPSIMALTKAIGHQESGGDYNRIGDNGHSKGAYQWNSKKPLAEGEVPENFRSYASAVGADGNDFSPANQDRVAYKTVEKWAKEEKLTPAQIASKWNSGDPDAYKTAKPGYNAKQGVNYDVGAYVNNVAKYYDEYNKSSGTPSSQQQKNSEGYITSTNIPEQKPEENLKAGNPGLIARATGVGKLGQGLGYAISNLAGTQKGLVNEQTQQDDIRANIQKQITDIKNQARSEGKTPEEIVALPQYQKLLKSLVNATNNTSTIANKVGDVGTGGITGGEVVGSAAQTLATVLTAPSIIKSGVGLLRGTDVLASPAIETAMKGFKIPMAEFNTLTKAEQVNALTESLKTANAVDKQVIQQAINKLLPTAIKEAGGKVAFSELYPKIATALGLVKGGAKTIGSTILYGAGINDITNKIKGLVK